MCIIEVKRHDRVATDDAVLHFNVMKYSAWRQKARALLCYIEAHDSRRAERRTTDVRQGVVRESGYDMKTW